MLSSSICNLLFQQQSKHPALFFAQICCWPSYHHPSNPDLHEPLLPVAIVPVRTINSLTERVTVLEEKVEALNTRIDEITDSNAAMVNTFTDNNAQMLDRFADAMVDETKRAFMDFENAMAYEKSTRRLSCPQ